MKITELPLINIIGSIFIIIIGLYFAWDSYKNQKKLKLTLAILTVLYGGYSSFESIMSSIEFKYKFDNLSEFDELTKIGNKAYSGDRESYLKLQKIATTTFDERRDAAVVEIEKIDNRYSKNVHLDDIKVDEYDSNNKIINEHEISTEKLISILLLDKRYLYRARCAQLLELRNEEYVHEALLLSIFTEDNLLVQQSSIRTFQKLIRYNSIYVLNPYDNLGYWYDNKDKIKMSITKNNDVSILPIDKFIELLVSEINAVKMAGENNEMLYWYAAGIELCVMIKENKTIESNN